VALTDLIPRDCQHYRHLSIECGVVQDDLSCWCLSFIVVSASWANDPLAIDDARMKCLEETWCNKQSEWNPHFRLPSNPPLDLKMGETCDSPRPRWIVGEGISGHCPR
jgi:hypothetical protein